MLFQGPLAHVGIRPRHCGKKTERVQVCVLTQQPPVEQGPLWLAATARREHWRPTGAALQSNCKEEEEEEEEQEQEQEEEGLFRANAVEEEEEEEEEGLFRANAVNEEDPERDRATQV